MARVMHLHLRPVLDPEGRRRWVWKITRTVGDDVVHEEPPTKAIAVQRLAELIRDGVSHNYIVEATSLDQTESGYFAKFTPDGKMIERAITGSTVLGPRCSNLPRTAEALAERRTAMRVGTPKKKPGRKKPAQIAGPKPPAQIAGPTAQPPAKRSTSAKPKPGKVSALQKYLDATSNGTDAEAIAAYIKKTPKAKRPALKRLKLSASKKATLTRAFEALAPKAPSAKPKPTRTTSKPKPARTTTKPKPARTTSKPKGDDADALLVGKYLKATSNGLDHTKIKRYATKNLKRTGALAKLLSLLPASKRAHLEAATAKPAKKPTKPPGRKPAAPTGTPRPRSKKPSAPPARTTSRDRTRVDRTDRRSPPLLPGPVAPPSGRRSTSAPRATTAPPRIRTPQPVEPPMARPRTRSPEVAPPPRVRTAPPPAYGGGESDESRKARLAAAAGAAAGDAARNALADLFK